MDRTDFYGCKLIHSSIMFISYSTQSAITHDGKRVSEKDDDDDDEEAGQ